MKAVPDESRACGECSLCCKVMKIEELEKPVGRWCPHCRPGQGGCSIYSGRPPSCRSFACAWLQGALPLEQRPDTTKVVFTESAAGWVAVHVDESFPDAADREPVAGQIQKLALKMPVVILCGETRRVVARSKQAIDALRKIEKKSGIPLMQYVQKNR